MRAVRTARYAPSSPNVAPDSPERCAHEEPYVLCKLQEGALKIEFVDDGGENQARHDLDSSETPRRILCANFAHWPQVIPRMPRVSAHLPRIPTKAQDSREPSQPGHHEQIPLSHSSTTQPLAFLEQATSNIPDTAPCRSPETRRSRCAPSPDRRGPRPTPPR